MLKMAKTRFHFISIISRFQMKDENQGNINKFLLHLMASKELKKRLEKRHNTIDSNKENRVSTIT